MNAVSLTHDARKATGAHYTPVDLAKFVASLIAGCCESKAPVVLDPACGDGELLLALHDELPGASLVGFDVDRGAIGVATNRLNGRFEQKDFLSFALDQKENALFSTLESFDAVIANPPYVRTQVLGADRAQELADQFGLTGRVDIYFAFLQGIAQILKPGGIAGIIVSNRFMTTKAGSTVRSSILEYFDILHVWDLGDTKLFNAAVLPAVLLLRKKNGKHDCTSKMSSIYTTKEDSRHSAISTLDALKLEGVVSVGDQRFSVRHGVLDASEGVWRIGSVATDRWLSMVNSRTFCAFGDIGKIRVGIKTTADKIFVKSDWPDPKPELLRPLLTHDVARRYKSLPSDWQVLYPQVEQNGRRVAVELQQFPVSKKYLESHRTALEKRTYVIDSGRQWFEIWVPHKPSLWKKPKLVFPDISEKPTFWMSLDDEIVQGDCYWITCGNEMDIDLLWLALAVANSCFIEEFYDHSFHNKLYSGRRRFMTQYVEKFPLPDPNTPLAKKIVATVKRIYDETPSQNADQLSAQLELDVRAAFGLEESLG